MALIEVQSGSVTLDSDSTLTDITITSVDTSRTWIIGYLTAATSSPGGYLLDLNLQSSTNIQARVDSWDDADKTLYWTVIEFSSASGITVQRGYGTGNQTLSPAITVADSHADIYQRNAGGSTGTDDVVYANITSTTNVNCYQSDSESGYWQVVDWNGYCSVSKHTDTLASGSISGSITASFTDYTQVALIGQADVSGSFDDEHLVRMWPSSNSAISWDRYTSGVSWDLFTYALEFTDDWAVQQVATAMDLDTDTNDYTITELDQDRAFITSGSIFGNWATPADSVDDNYRDSGIAYYFTTDTNMQATRFAHNVECDGYAFVVEDVHSEAEAMTNLRGNLQGGFSGGFL